MKMANLQLFLNFLLKCMVSGTHMQSFRKIHFVASEIMDVEIRAINNAVLSSLTVIPTCLHKMMKLSKLHPQNLESII